jgi:uncharacterized membrane protein YccF (DUF307 family)
MKVINVVLNVIWLLFCGLWMAIGYAIAGIVCFVLIITIPFGIAAFRLAGFMLWPFGRTTVEKPDAGAASCVGNVIWLVFAGWWLALHHIILAVPLAVSIIGIPFAWQHVKLAGLALTPVGKGVVEV